MESQHPSLETLQDIKRMMERSSRFISLSGLSGLSAGLIALGGAFIASGWMEDYSLGKIELDNLKIKLILLAISVLLAALIAAFYFTWRKARKQDQPIWDPGSKKLLINLLIPLATGGLFVAGLIYHSEWRFVAPACLVFYGLALVNASKYTFRDIRYVGLVDILLGITGMYFAKYGLYFWAVGFGLLHVVYGLIMWWKYDLKQEA